VTLGCKEMVGQTTYCDKPGRHLWRHSLTGDIMAYCENHAAANAAGRFLFEHPYWKKLSEEETVLALVMLG